MIQGPLLGACVHCMTRATVWVLGGLASLVAACASSQASGEPALLLATDAYELHLRDGRVYVLTDGAVRPIADYGELHTLYRRDGAPLVPEAPAGETATVLGWRDLACVRAAQTCGREPDAPARDMVRLRLRF
jgi:hypothetical protein